MKTITIIIALLYVSIVKGQVIKDTIFLTNGSLVIGKVLKVKLGVISFDPDDANDITVQMRKLKTIGATTRIFRVETYFSSSIFRNDNTPSRKKCYLCKYGNGYSVFETGIYFHPIPI